MRPSARPTEAGWQIAGERRSSVRNPRSLNAGEVGLTETTTAKAVALGHARRRETRPPRRKAGAERGHPPPSDPGFLIPSPSPAASGGLATAVARGSLRPSCQGASRQPAAWALDRQQTPIARPRCRAWGSPLGPMLPRAEPSPSAERSDRQRPNCRSPAAVLVRPSPVNRPAIRSIQPSQFVSIVRA
jgi:hypothetical protein